MLCYLVTILLHELIQVMKYFLPIGNSMRSIVYCAFCLEHNEIFC